MKDTERLLVDYQVFPNILAFLRPVEAGMLLRASQALEQHTRSDARPDRALDL
jgi:hypothetical protein